MTGYQTGCACRSRVMGTRLDTLGDRYPDTNARCCRHTRVGNRVRVTGTRLGTLGYGYPRCAGPYQGRR